MVLYLRLKSAWAVEITMYVHWTCIDVNKENDVLKRFQIM